jgi:hypothetical protein
LPRKWSVRVDREDGLFFFQAQHSQHRLRLEVMDRQGSQFNQTHAITKIIDHARSGLQREARLAAAARSGEGDQASYSDMLPYFGNLFLSSMKLVNWYRGQVMRRGFRLSDWLRAASGR